MRRPAATKAGEVSPFQWNSKLVSSSSSLVSKDGDKGTYGNKVYNCSTTKSNFSGASAKLSLVHRTLLRLKNFKYTHLLQRQTKQNKTTFCRVNSSIQNRSGEDELKSQPTAKRVPLELRCRHSSWETCWFFQSCPWYSYCLHRNSCCHLPYDHFVESVGDDRCED